MNLCRHRQFQVRNAKRHQLRESLFAKPSFGQFRLILKEFLNARAIINEFLERSHNLVHLHSQIQCQTTKKFILYLLSECKGAQHKINQFIYLRHLDFFAIKTNSIKYTFEVINSFSDVNPYQINGVKNSHIKIICLAFANVTHHFEIFRIPSICTIHDSQLYN